MTSPDDRLPSGLRLEAAVAAVVIAVAVVGLALLPITTPQYVRALVIAVGSEGLTSLGKEGTLDAAESVRRFVTDRSAPGLPATLDGAPAFDADAVSHLADVRAVLLPARVLALVAGSLACVWCLVRARTGAGRRAVGAALRGAGWLLVAGGSLALVAGALDFDAFFAWFHSLLFEAGTWVFPADALLIRLFPLRFWIAAGATWAGLVLVAAVVLIVVGGRLRYTRSPYGV